jgi:endo-1,4-beta-xylanase
LKWERVHPQPNSYSFEMPDRYVSFGETNHMFIVGHALVPAWVFQDENGNPADREALLKAHERPHQHGGGPLPRAHQRLGRRQRGP